MSVLADMKGVRRVAKYLEVSEVRCGRIQKADGRELYCRVKTHIFEAAKTRNERRSPFPAILLAHGFVH